ncbi:MAG: hypothetical protein KIS61_33340 [Candidatus Eremiobacteraeota bacterium]|nr:hypothetical protein [Candidatus Eremiobacteraeota bacterium]
MQIQLNTTALANLTRNQLLRQLPEADRRAVDSFQGGTVRDMVEHANRRATSEKPLAARISQGVGLASTLGAASSAAIALFANHSLPVLGASAGLAGLAAAGFWIGSRLTQSHRKGISAQADQLGQLAQQKAETLLSVQGDRVTDARFLNDFAFQNPVEIKETGSANLLERSVTIAGDRPIVLRENPAEQEVTMSWADRSVTFPGTLSLPTVDQPQAIIAVDNGDPNEDNLSVFQYRFDQQGKMQVHALSDVSWDSDGFSYQQDLELGRTTETQLNADGTAYVRNDYGRSWYGVQTPDLPQPFTGSGVPGKLVIPAERNSDLKLTLDVRHGPLPDSVLTPVFVEDLPARVDFHNVSLHNQDNEVTIEAGAYRQSFPGQVDKQGRVHINNHFGTLTQTLDNHIRLEQTVLSGKLQLTHKGDKISASYQSKNHGNQEVSAQESAPGTYSLLYEGGEIEIQAPVPAHLIAQ